MTKTLLRLLAAIVPDPRTTASVKEAVYWRDNLRSLDGQDIVQLALDAAGLEPPYRVIVQLPSGPTTIHSDRPAEELSRDEVCTAVNTSHVIGWGHAGRDGQYVEVATGDQRFLAYARTELGHVGLFHSVESGTLAAAVQQYARSCDHEARATVCRFYGRPAAILGYGYEDADGRYVEVVECTPPEQPSSPDRWLLVGETRFDDIPLGLYRTHDEAREAALVWAANPENRTQMVTLVIWPFVGAQPQKPIFA